MQVALHQKWGFPLRKKFTEEILNGKRHLDNVCVFVFLPDAQLGIVKSKEGSPKNKRKISPGGSFFLEIRGWATI